MISSEDLYGKTRRKDLHGGELERGEDEVEGEIGLIFNIKTFHVVIFESVKGGSTKTSKNPTTTSWACWERRTRREEREFFGEGRTAIKQVLEMDRNTKKSRRQTMNFTKLNVARLTTKSTNDVLEVLEDNTLRANFKDGTVVIKAMIEKLRHVPITRVGFLHHP